MRRTKNITPHVKKIIALAAAGVVATSTVVGTASVKTSAVETADDANESDEEVLTETAKELLKTTTKSDVNGKEETVYVIDDADGNKNQVIVSNWLKNGDGADDLVDKTDLTDIENTKGDETYTENEDGTITWDAHGNDIYYKGNSSDELPVNVHISYKLDGKEVTADELKGASGHLTIEFTYENNETKTVQINGEDVNLAKPCAVVSGLLLDGETSSNVTVTNGKVVNDGDRNIVVGLAVPGMLGNLDLSDLDDDATNKIEELLPETVTIEADVTDFSMSGTISLATYDVPLSTDLDSLQSKLDELKDSANTLQDGANQLVDGAASLKDYLGQLKDGTDTLADGTGQLSSGAASLSSGASQLSSGTETLKNGADSLSSGASQLSEGLNQLSTSVSALPSGANQLYVGAQKLQSALKSGNSSSVDTYGVYEAVTAIGNGADQLKSVLSSIMKGAEDISTGAQQIAVGAKSGSTDPNTYGIYEAAAALESALTTTITNLQNSLATAAGTLNSATAYNSAAAEAVQALVDANKITDEEAAAITGNITGANAVVSGVQSALTGTSIDTKQITDVITAIKNGSETIYNGAQSIAAGAKSNNTEDTSKYGLYEAAAAAYAGANTLSTSAKTLASKIDYMAGSENMGALVDGLASLNSQSSQLISAISQLSSGANSLNSGASTLANGTATVNNGASTLASGASSADSGAKKLSSAAAQLLEGAGTLSDGINTLNEDGISKIVDLMGDKATKLYDRLQAIVDYAQEDNSFSGVTDGTDCSVSYIFKTGEISD